jgi:non-homologous end joining protein Ku
MVEIAGTSMKRRAGKFEPAEFRDRNQDALREFIIAEAKRKGPTKRRALPTGGNVVDLMTN